ncbi:hypothetical protein D918_04199 [Trichuris suis]|nr:hypothetical protein D918_04199 [Trichuris suis]
MLLPAFGDASRVADLLSNMMINCPNATPRECFLEYMEKCIDSEIMDVVVMRVVPDGNETIRYGIRFEMIKGWRFLHCAITDEMPLVAQMVVFPLTAHEELPALLNRLDRPGENRTMSTAYCSDENRTMNTECIPPKWDRYFRQRNYSAQKQVNNTPRVQRRRTDGTEVNLSVENLLDSFVFKPSSWRHRF